VTARTSVRLALAALMLAALPAGAQSGRAAAVFEAMAALAPALAGVPALSAAQRDSLAAVEQAWRPRFRKNGEALLALFERAHAAGSAPDVDAVRALDSERRAVWLGELRAARALLRDDQQRARFDANVTALLGGAPGEESLGDGSSW
jgi:hypothetical protein